MMRISKEQFKMMGESNLALAKENKELRNKVKQLSRLIGLYEACLSHGVPVDFPNSSGKGGNADNTSDDTFDFDDF